MNATCPPNPGAGYEIRLSGKLHPRWMEWFDGFTITVDEARGETLLRSQITDQSALHGALAKIRDLNLEIIEIRRW